MSAKQVFISELTEGQQVKDIFLVARKNLAETKAGKPYLALTLMDRTGDIEARVWDKAVNFDDQTGVGSYIRVTGTAKSFRDSLQLGIVFLEKLAAESIKPADFMPASKRSVQVMEEELDGIIGQITHPGLKALLESIFSGETRQQFCTAPAAKKMHHACLGGLLEHTLSVAGLALKVLEHYPGLDRDILLCGALLHDLAKIREFSFSAPPFDYTDQGRLMGHLVLGVDMVRQAAAGIDELEEDRLDQVCHLILSHHGRYEFGAPVLPMTQEALLLHHLDDMDAKMNYTDQLREKMTGPGGYQWSEYQRPLERFLFLQPLSEPEASVEYEVVKPAGQTRKKVKMDQQELLKRQQRLF